MKHHALSGACVLLLIASSPAVRAGDEAYAWLERMSAAMSQMNYQGTFVYVQDGDVQTMRITHVAEGGDLRERLVSISGLPREVVRDSSGVRWISGKDRAALADPAVNRPIFFDLPLSDAAQASDSYDFRLRAGDRIAGHSAQRLDIEPRDHFRYGYSLWLEAQSGLLLQWQVNGGNGDLLARLMFTDLKMGSEVDREELRSATGLEPVPSDLPPEGRAPRRAPAWAPDRLPPGFHLASHRAPDVDPGGWFEHLVYSDGIAAVSVYVESIERRPRVAPGLSRMGTTHAFSRAVNGMFVTVVGDVPEATVKLIGDAVGPFKP
jgi:sigma-E factor negative regulatory protein RseB